MESAGGDTPITADAEVQPPLPPPEDEKPAKKKRVMTEEQKENLKKAREKALEVRKDKAAKAKAAAEPKPEPEEEKELTKEERLHKFAEEVNEELEAKKAAEAPVRSKATL